MAQFLVKAVDHVHPDTGTDDSASYKKGDIVFIHDDTADWGLKEGLPVFVIVKVPGLSLATVQDKRETWDRVIDWEIVATDVALDGARIRVYATVPGAASEYGLTRDKVESWINRWGGTVVSVAPNEVRFDITISDIYQSVGFWEADPSDFGIVINEVGYTQSTGVHTVEIDVTAATIPLQRIQERIISEGGVITGFSSGIATVEFYRNLVREQFKQALKTALFTVNKRRRYCFSPADVDTAIAMGGEVTLTTTQLIARLIDKAAS